MHGHYWTLRPFVRHLFRPQAPPPSRHFRATLVDPVAGSIELSGRLQSHGSRELVLAIHGLGGSHASNYLVALAGACAHQRIDCLRLCLRGADRRGHDLHHAGLVADIAAALDSPALAHYDAIRLIGYSMGGHLALRYAAGAPDERLRCVATVCSPLDLEAGCHEIDRPHRALYRRNVLRGLKQILEAVNEAGGPAPLEMERADRITKLEEWDELVVAPRFGFDGARHYWRTQSAYRTLGDLKVPALSVVTRRDPMVLAHTVEPHLEANPHVEAVLLDEGGHVGFPPDIDLGLRRAPGGASVSEQLLHWMRGQ